LTLRCRASDIKPTNRLTPKGNWRPQLLERFHHALVGEIEVAIAPLHPSQAVPWIVFEYAAHVLQNSQVEGITVLWHESVMAVTFT
jgi:hypothetical protein